MRRYRCVGTKGHTDVHTGREEHRHTERKTERYAEGKKWEPRDTEIETDRVLGMRRDTETDADQRDGEGETDRQRLTGETGIRKGKATRDRQTDKETGKTEDQDGAHPGLKYRLWHSQTDRNTDTHTHSDESHAPEDRAMCEHSSDTQPQHSHQAPHRQSHSTCLSLPNLKPIYPLPLLQAFVLRVAH